MITKDSVTVYVNAIMYYKVFANIKTLIKVPKLISNRIMCRWSSTLLCYISLTSNEIGMMESK